MSDSVPASVKRALSTLSESIFIVALVLVTALVFVGMATRLHRLANVATLLPESTEAFIVVNLRGYGEAAPVLLTDFYGQDLRQTDWFKRDTALAWVDGELIRFVEVSSSAKAMNFMESLKIEDEEWVKENGIRCFEFSQPDCFRMDGEFLILGSRNALEALKPGLEDSARYQNIRHRLPYDATLFAYANTQEVRQAFATSLGELSFVEPGYLESVLRIFPAFGSSLKREGDEWRSESFVAVDKSMLRDSAFFHPSERHKGRFQEFLPQGHAFEWSGVELLELETSLHAHLETLNPAAALVWEQKMQELWSPYFGDVNREAYASFLNGEQSLVWTPSETFVWMLQIEEAERELALELNDHFISNYQSPQMRTVSGGEQQASLEVLNASRENHEGDDYFAIGPEGALTHWVAILDEVVIASNDETEFFETLDRYRGRSDLASMDNRQDMLLGTDHQFSLDMTTLPESHIIRMLLPGIAQWTGSVKLFDDGIYLRALFHS